MANILGYLTLTDPNTLLTTVLLPFILIFVIIWGVLQMTKMFGHSPEAKKINIVIAFVITLFAAFTDAWGVIATQLAAFSGVFAFVVFFIVVIIGIIMWATGRTRNIYNTQSYHGYNYNNLKDLDKNLAKIAKKIREADNKGQSEKVRVLSETYDELDKRKKLLLKQAELRSGHY